MRGEPRLGLFLRRGNLAVGLVAGIQVSDQRLGGFGQPLAVLVHVAVKPGEPFGIQRPLGLQDARGGPDRGDRAEDIMHGFRQERVMGQPV